MAGELAKISYQFRDSHPNDEVIVVGDFNAPNFKWKFDEDNPGFL